MTRPRLGRLFVAATCAALALLGVRPAQAQEPAVPAVAGGANEEAVPSSRVQFRVFGNTDWQSRREADPNSFSLGQVDLFATAQLAPNVSALAEVVLEGSTQSEEHKADVERFQLRYAPTDAIAVAVGRMHTVLGFWNQTYHHGLWLQTTIERPEVYRWEDDAGGFLPVHEVGLRLSGSASTSPLRFEYSASLVNGRAARASEVALKDANDSKAVNLWFALKPRAVPALQFGGTAVFDRIPPDAASGRESELDERILGGFLAYQGLRLELLAEAFAVRHEDAAQALAWTSTGLYAQGAVALGRFKPYYRYDQVRRAEEDTFLDATRDIAKHTVGLRVDPWRQVALKFELVHGALSEGEHFNSAAVQAAFTF
jgi:hypothetical protein